MLEVADVFRRHGGDYARKFGHAMPPSHRRALEDIVQCRTEALGGQVFRCDHCGREQYAYHSCRNRSCPKCHTKDTEDWLEERRGELLPVPYFHLVFTLPAELRAPARRHQKTVYALLMRAAARALIKLVRDPRHVGGLTGVLCVLHTWTRALAYHPHVHCLVPAGGVSPTGDAWLAACEYYLVPVKALSRLFRGMVRDLMARELPDLQVPASVWRADWVVYCEPALQGTDKVLGYLGRYVHRIAITNSRILAIEDGQVTFRYKDSRQRRWKTMTLRAEEFIRRFLQHVLPAGFHKVRYYGLWSPTHRERLDQVRLQLGLDQPPRRDPPLETASQPAEASATPTPPVAKCPHCGIGALVYSAPIPRPRRTPP